MSALIRKVAISHENTNRRFNIIGFVLAMLFVATVGFTSASSASADTPSCPPGSACGGSMPTPTPTPTPVTTPTPTPTPTKPVVSVPPTKPVPVVHHHPVVPSSSVPFIPSSPSHPSTFVPPVVVNKPTPKKVIKKKVVPHKSNACALTAKAPAKPVAAKAQPAAVSAPCKTSHTALWLFALVAAAAAAAGVGGTKLYDRRKTVAPTTTPVVTP